MTNDGDTRTPIDQVIDEVASQMTSVRAPDVRTRVMARLETPPSVSGWWKPAAAVFAVVVAMFAVWPREVQLPRHPRESIERTLPTSAFPNEPQRLPQVASSGPSVAANARSRQLRVDRFTRPDIARAESETLPVLPPIDVPPVTIYPLAIETTHPIEPVDMPALVIEPLNVAPLTRSVP